MFGFIRSAAIVFAAAILAIAALDAYVGLTPDFFDRLPGCDLISDHPTIAAVLALLVIVTAFAFPATSEQTP